MQKVTLLLSVKGPLSFLELLNEICAKMPSSAASALAAPVKQAVETLCCNLSVFIDGEKYCLFNALGSADQARAAIK